MRQKHIGAGLLLVIGFLISGGSTATAQVEWPEITGQTKPWARWWWEGSAVNDKDLTKVMEQYHAAGIGGLEITPIYGVRGQEAKFIDFLSPEWMEVFTHTLQEGKRLGLGIDLANATGWPFGGPWVSPADASKELQYKIYTVAAGAKLDEKVEFIQQPLVRTEGPVRPDISQIKRPVSSNDNLQEMALDQLRFRESLPLVTLMAFNGRHQPIDLTDKVDSQGRLRWQAPAGQGDWKLYAVFEGQHGKMVERAAPGGEGFVIDHFSAKAVKDYLGRFDKAFRGVDLSGLRAFFNDSYEVDDARGQADFTPGFFDIFKQRRGYDLRQYLPALLGPSTDDTSLRVLTDYRRTIGELLLEHFTETWEQWAKHYHKIIRNQSHGSPANILDLYGAIDIPETEGRDRLRFKFASSAAHVLGKPLVSSESATWLKDHFLASWGDVKSAMDLYFLGGVNHTLYHGIAYSPQDAPWPGWLFYAAVHFSPTNPQWSHFRAFNAYIARCQSFLQQGKPDNDLLQYYPLFDSYAGRGRGLLNHYDGMKGFEGTAFDANANWLLNHGYGFDFISDNQIEKLTTEGGKLISPGGSYKVLLLSEVTYLPLATLKRLMTLVDEGAQLVVYKSLPQDVPGLGNLAERQKQFRALVSSLHFMKSTSGVAVAAHGKGRVWMGDDLGLLLAAARIRPELMVSYGLQYTRRKNGEHQYTYFMVNRGDKEVRGWIPLGKPARGVVAYSPMSRKAGKLPVTTRGNGLPSVYLQLEPGESIVLKTEAGEATGADYPYYQAAAAQPVTLKDGWSLHFSQGGPSLPEARKLKTLQFWTAIDAQDSALSAFSGIGVYATDFTKKELGIRLPAHWRLDLGEVKENASVWLNGQQLGVVLGPHYDIDFPARLLKADNHLEIRVASLMANRIRFMDQHHIHYKKFYNTNFPAHDAQDRGPDGLFTAAGWSVMPSGLAGPVRLIPLEPVQPPGPPPDGK